MAKINVLMLTHKSENWLSRVLPPLIDNRIHFIAVDSGADESANVIQQYFPDAIILKSKSANLAYLRNLALRESEQHPSDYTAFIDSDMVMPPSFYDRTIQILNNNVDCGVVCVAGILNFQGNTYTARFWRNFKEPEHSLIEQQYVCTGSTMFLTEAVKDIVIDERCRRSDEDVDLCCQVGLRGYKVLCDYHPPYTVHIRDASVKAELSRYVQFGKHRPITLLKYGPPKLIVHTILTDSLTIGSIICWFLEPFYGIICLLPTAIIFGRHLLKVKKKWRVDHVVFSMLLSYVYNTLCGIYLVRHLIAGFRRGNRL